MITPRLLVRIGEAIQLNPAVSLLRRHFPDLHFSECTGDDVSPRYRAALSFDGYDLYLVSGAPGHCFELTDDPATATGILVAAKTYDA
ncbi:MAG: hypothetical protein HY777_09965 [Betaproteobacteria bacterium]|nr:hypothetical protein [Betaproteobacteria bacterium]